MNNARMDGGDRGQIALPMVVVTLAVAIVATATLMVMGRLLVDRARAQTAADAAALAGAAEGEAAARAVALGNGAVVTSIEISGDTTVVTVVHGWASATAGAERFYGSS